MKLGANFTFDKVCHDQKNDVHLVVSLTAPKKDWQKERPPVCVVPVIDVSGSMEGEPLEYAKKSAIKLVEHLQPGDFAGLVMFHSGVQLVSPVMEMTQDKKAELQSKIGGLRTMGCTNFSGGMLMGLEQVNNADMPKNVICRIIMLTDGGANQGVATTREDLIPLLKEKLGRASCSNFGYGIYADQELLADLSKTGNGNYAFIENPDKALSAFAKELGGLLSTFAQNITVEIKSNNGHKINEVISDVDASGDDRSVVIDLPEILSEEERHIVVSTTLSKQSKVLPRMLNAFDVVVSYDVVGKDGEMKKVSETLKAKMSFVKKGKEQDKADERLDKIVALAQTVAAQIKAEEMAQQGNYNGAVMYMQDLSCDLNSRGLNKFADNAVVLGNKMGSASLYASNSSYFTTSASLGTRSVGLSGGNSDALEAFDCCVGDVVTTSTTAQKDLDAKFNDSISSTNDINLDLDNDSASGHIDIVEGTVRAGGLNVGKGGITFESDSDLLSTDAITITTGDMADLKKIIEDSKSSDKKSKKDKKKSSRVTKKKSKRW